ncbi:hypothetical protein AMAG_06536 [Allomyces macrogynus ATCC 38327]|uniref:Trafficking protein particle complex subunit BET3 n=1 Tax=Allomyces macrogynus (strain ATCC 38327) TaxID=578462 RepID=A0A0L0SH07_ALLM3|nr:hypothetical protein AMAG_06536 [Allomyces macrogynus ATCC 38327]|eukprot:KNE61734.1 hypothetical protein AMAG_06536 [Allomyces macrogynus ATCC 38327]
MAKTLKTLGEDVWRTKVEKVNGELFALTYGSIVTQLCRDFNNNYAKVNAQLDKMGYNMGMRLIEEFLARSQLGRCRDFRDTAETVAKVAFKMFLNISPAVTNVAPDAKAFSLVFDENPLAEFVELPEAARRRAVGSAAGPVENGDAMASAPAPLWFSNVLCGVVRGALEMVQLQVDARWVSDVLLGDECSEMRVTLIKVLEDEVPAGED